jgi:hypothetical protein
MSDASPPTCQTCRFFAPFARQDPRLPDRAGWCRRFPPSSPQPGLRFSDFPGVFANSWCGEWQSPADS